MVQPEAGDHGRPSWRSGPSGNGIWWSTPTLAGLPPPHSERCRRRPRPDPGAVRRKAEEALERCWSRSPTTPADHPEPDLGGSQESLYPVVTQDHQRVGVQVGPMARIQLAGDPHLRRAVSSEPVAVRPSPSWPRSSVVGQPDGRTDDRRPRFKAVGDRRETAGERSPRAPPTQAHQTHAEHGYTGTRTGRYTDISMPVPVHASTDTRHPRKVRPRRPVSPPSGPGRPRSRPT